MAMTLDSDASKLLDKALTIPLVASSFLAALGSFSFGYNLGSVNTPSSSFTLCPAGSSVWQCFPISDASWGLIPSVLSVGALFGSLLAGPLANRLGRRSAVLCANGPYLVGLLLMSLALNYWMLLVGRILIGIGVGISCIAAPLYLTEICTVSARGLIGSMHQMMICTGLLVAELVGYSGLYRPLYWRFMIALDILPCLLQLVGMAMVSPESPRHLLLRNEQSAGEAALRRLRGSHFSQAEVHALLDAAADSTTETWGLTELLTTHRGIALKSLLIASFLHIGQQLSGINSILFFSSSIFAQQQPSSPASSPSMVPPLIGLLNLVMTVFAIMAIDRAGRRFLAISSSSVMFLSSLALTFGFVTDQRALSVAAVLGFVGSFAFGLGPVPWLMTNELFPTKAAGSAVALAVCCNWLANLTVTATFAPLMALLGNYAFVPYSICILIFLLFSLFLLPETRGRPADFI